MIICRKCKSTIGDGIPYCPRCGELTGTCPEPDEYTYEAFISYRHLSLSSEAARHVQRGIEGYRIPKGVGVNRSKRRLGKVFRDEDELPASTSLSSQILEALQRSRFLIVVCTPETRESRWVEQEIELFASLHGRDRILVALAEGERSQCLPNILLYRKVVSEDGSVVEEPTEPLAADFRSKSRKSCKDETLRLIAALLGCGFDDLRQRERARRNALAARIAAGVVVIAMAFSAIVLYQRGQILERQRQQQISQSRYLAREVDELLASGKRMQAIQTALDALPQDSNKKRPFVPEACAALERAVQAYPTEHAWLPLYSNSSTNDIEGLATNGDAGTYATIDDVGSLKIYRLQDGHLLNTIPLLDEGEADSSWIDWTIDSYGDAYLAFPKHGKTVRSFNAATGKENWTYNTPEEAYSYGISSDGTRMCLTGYEASDDCSSWTGVLRLIDMSTGHPLSSIRVPVSDHSNSRVALDETGSHICATFGKDLVLADETGQISATASLVQPYAYDAIWAGEVAIVIEVDELGVDYPCTVQAFTWQSEGNTLWSFDTTMSIIASNGQGFSPSAEFFGSYEMADGSKHVICGLGNSLLLIEASGGEVTTIGKYGSPICAVSQVRGKAGAWSRACTVYDGVSEDALEGRILGQERSSIELDPPSIASFATAQSQDYLATAPFDDTSERHSICVYKLAMPLNERLAEPTESALSFKPGDAREPTKRERTIIDKVLSEGGIDWKQDGYVAVSTNGKHAIVQALGIVFHISIADKALCGMSENIYEAFADGGFTSDARLFYARCSTKDFLGSEKLYVFDLKGDRFEARSAITYGSALSSDGASVLIETSATSYALPYLTPEQLIELGEELLSES